MNTIFHYESERELESGFLWYEEQVAGLGYAFLEGVYSAIRRIKQYPRVGNDFGEEVRRVLIRRFPYCLWYAVEEEVVVIYAVAHLHREPQYWISRLNK